MLISLANSLPVLTSGTSTTTISKMSVTDKSTRADTVSISSAAIKAAQDAIPPLSADQVAEEMRGQFLAVEAMTSMLNLVKGCLAESVKPEFLTDEKYEEYISDMKKNIVHLTEGVASRVEYLKSQYNASGDFPSQQTDGTWSKGNYTGFVNGNGFSIKADSSINILMSKNGGIFAKWIPSPNGDYSIKNSIATVALELMNKISSSISHLA